MAKDTEVAPQAILADGEAEPASAGSSRPYVLSIHTLAPEPYFLARPIPVVIEQSAEDCVASFVEANVSASGCSAADAISGLKEIIVSRLESLGGTPAAKLGKPLLRQLAVLRDFVRKAS